MLEYWSVGVPENRSIDLNGILIKLQSASVPIVAESGSRRL
ncbi:hypothetical protein D1AOALGA4SA_10039 [Olavius algarvensis Delta 1 endosymbiont]|nr:hypothetical protein D1AOALGA4SA_10039 [Olavius algarvensis Delta 1 endosymbiont]